MKFETLLIQREAMLVGGKEDWEIAHLKDRVSAYGIQVRYLEEEKSSDAGQSALAGIKNPKECLLIAATDEEIAFADKRGMATIAFLNPDITGQSYQKAQILVEGFEEVDYYFLERIYNRKHKIPWRVIDTNRCYLREMTLADLDALYELYAGKDIAKYMEPLYKDRAKEAAYTKAYIENQYYYYGYGMWVVIERATGRLIGRAGLNNQELHGEVELEMGYAIAADKQRQGYAFEICEKILQYAESFLEFESVNCLVQKENTASVSLLHKLGFRWEEEMMSEGKCMQRYVRFF